jgi:2',3'-cyclic-nucleotide 2'-phosphodiesterase (5'-nucleotidase family)
VKLRLLAIFLFVGLTHAKEVAITVLHTTDLHANLLPRTNYLRQKDTGGIARCAWMIKKIRSEQNHVLLVDAGDLYQGSPIGYRTRGSVMIRAINALKYDSWTLGNHELDWGIKVLASRIAESQTPVLAANFHHSPTSTTDPKVTTALKKIQPYIIREFEGVKVGIVGLDTPGIPSWSRLELIPGIDLESSVSALKRVIPEMKAKGCHILILVTHQGLQERGDDHDGQIMAITRSFPELDAIVGGHTHRVHPQQQVNGVLYSQAGYWGGTLGKIDLSYDTEMKKIISKKADVLTMDSSIPLNTDFLSPFQKEIDETEVYLSTKLGEASAELHSFGAPKKETPLFNLICAAIHEAIKNEGSSVDAVLHGTLTDRALIHAGPITIRDLFEIVPYENMIGVLTLTRDQYLEILEENASAYYTDRFRGLWGMNMKLKPSATDGQRVIFVGDSKGQSLSPDRKILVAFNSYDLASGGRRWNRLRKLADDPSTQLKLYPILTRDALIDYIRKHSPIEPETRAWWSLERAKP